jgi:hypothetical protein
MSERAFHALKVARAITNSPDGLDFKLGVMADPESWPILEYRPVRGISAGGGLTRNEAIQLLSAMLLDITEMPEYAK